MFSKNSGWPFTPLGSVLFFSIGPFALWGAIHLFFLFAYVFGRFIASLVI